MVVPNGKGWGKKQELFLELKHIVKIGEDVILVNVGYPRSQKGDKRNPGMPISPPQAGFYGGAPNGRNFEEYE